MNLQLTGRHVEITPAMREYVATKLARAEVSLHVSGRDLFCEAVETDMYVAIDAMADRLDRMVVRHKEKQTDHRGHAPVEPQAS